MMKAKDVIKGIEEGFDDNEQIADAVAWVEDAANRLAEFEQDNHMQDIEIQKLKAELAALKAAQWQPIESAPRDGKPVLLRVAHGSEWNGGVFSARWSAEMDAWMLSPFHDVRNPTHWMPLPTPPENAK